MTTHQLTQLEAAMRRATAVRTLFDLGIFTQEEVLEEINEIRRGVGLGPLHEKYSKEVAQTLRRPSYTG
jgi:hypothetical protein